MQAIGPLEQEVPPAVRFQTYTPGGGMKVQDKSIGRLKTNKQLNTDLANVDYKVKQLSLFRSLPELT